MVVFDDFLKRNLKLTSKSYRTYEEFEKDVPKADIYCTGSDQVWNSYWNEGIDYSLFLCLKISLSFLMQQVLEKVN